MWWWLIKHVVAVNTADGGSLYSRWWWWTHQLVTVDTSAGDGGHSRWWQ